MFFVLPIKVAETKDGLPFLLSNFLWYLKIIIRGLLNEIQFLFSGTSIKRLQKEKVNTGGALFSVLSIPS